jgi:hypothetical protein
MPDGRDPLAREAERVRPMTLLLSDCTLPKFMSIAEYFGGDEYGLRGHAQRRSPDSLPR